MCKRKQASAGICWRQAIFEQQVVLFGRFWIVSWCFRQSLVSLCWNKCSITCQLSPGPLWCCWDVHWHCCHCVSLDALCKLQLVSGLLLVIERCFGSVPACLCCGSTHSCPQFSFWLCIFYFSTNHDIKNTLNLFCLLLYLNLLLNLRNKE